MADPQIGILPESSIAAKFPVPAARLQAAIPGPRTTVLSFVGAQSIAPQLALAESLDEILLGWPFHPNSPSIHAKLRS
jgi:hypothetical protein